MILWQDLGNGWIVGLGDGGRGRKVAEIRTLPDGIWYSPNRGRAGEVWRTAESVEEAKQRCEEWAP